MILRIKFISEIYKNISFDSDPVKIKVEVMQSTDKWYGVTYKEDKPVVVAAIQRMKDEGLYPQHLWEGK